MSKASYKQQMQECCITRHLLILLIPILHLLQVAILEIPVFCYSEGEENGDFEQVDELTAGAQLIKRTLDGWLDTVSQEQRERAIDQIYGIFAAAGYGNIADLVEHWTDSLPKIVEAARNTDRETRGLIRAVIKAIPVSAAKAVREG